MSLLLRKETQTILDAAKLGQLHTTIVNRTLCIVGECGKRVVAIYGISFSRNQLTKEEISYATELFAAFITKHKAKLLDYVKQRKAFKLLPEPVTQTPEITKLSYGQSIFWKIRVPITKKRNILVTMRFDNSTVKLEDAHLKDLALIDGHPLIKEAQTLDTAYKLYVQTENNINKLVKDLESCDI